jgi:hypothetical protein
VGLALMWRADHDDVRRFWEAGSQGGVWCWSIFGTMGTPQACPI